ncbi:MAG: carbohydrate ABC transporter permease [Oligoflexales bacterium]
MNHKLKYLVFIPAMFLAIAQFFPIYVIALTSFKTPLALMEDGMSLSFIGLSLENYEKVLTEDGFLSHIWVSLTVAIFATFFSIIIASLAAFALARFKFRGKKFLTLTILCSRMVPPVALAMPVFLLVDLLGVHDTIWGLVIAHMSFILPFCIWILLPFFVALPHDLGEAAVIDGLSSTKIFSMVYLPLALPGVLVASIFCFLFSWNDFLYSLILAGSQTKTAPLAINAYMTSDRIEWGAMSASSMIVMVPIFLLSLLVQKHFAKGVPSAGIKG